MAGWIKAKELSRAAWLAIIGLNVVAFALLVGLYTWRINTFEHAVATVVSVRTVEKPLRKKRNRYVTLGELSFKRTDKDGTVIDCQHEFEIGRPDDGYRIGDQFKVVVATGSCQRLDILGPIGRRP